MNKAQNLILQLLSLSKIKDPGLILELFLDSLKNLWPNAEFLFADEEKAGFEVIAIQSQRRFYRFLNVRFAPTDHHHENCDLVKNAVSVLEIFLEKLELDDVLKKEKILLEDSVKGRIVELEMINRQLLDEIAQKEKALQLKNAADQRCRFLVEKFPLPIVVHIQGKIIFANPSAEFFFMHEMKKGIVGSSLASIVHEDSREEIQKLISNGKEKTKSSEIKIKRLDGSAVMLDVISLLVNYNGETTEMIIFSDISARKDQEEALRKSELKYRTLAESIPDYLFRFDLNLEVIYLNQAAHIFLKNNFPNLNPMAFNMEKLFIDKKFPFFANAVKKVKKNRKPLQIQLENFQGNPNMVLDWHISPEFSDHGKVVSFLCDIRDISHAKKIEQEKLELQKQLKHVQKMEALGNLAGGIAHDFNNVLSSIIGFADMMKEEIAEGSSLDNHLKQILIAADRARTMIRQILTFGRKSESTYIPIQLAMIISESITLLQKTLPASIKIKVNLSENTMITGDPSSIHQIMFNLCSNAAYAMKESGGTIHIELKDVTLNNSHWLVKRGLKAGEYAAIVIRDTGTGISEELRERIFEPYFTTKPVTEGTGMGLAVVHGIMKSHNGEIMVNSKLGKGATFSLFFPKFTGQIAIKKTEMKTFPIGHESILVVDDEENLAIILKHLLERQGYQVSAFSDSLTAFEYFKNNAKEIDLIITDMNMAGLSGLELTERARKIKKTIPVILLTGYSDQIDKQTYKDQGLDGYLMKPVKKDKLAQLIRSIFDDPEKKKK
jgi:PAS domain S-box-containing protein